MRAPAFWWRTRPSLAARLLQPAGAVYGAVTAARMARPGTRMPLPVVCIGNFVAGGAGKTPVALAVAHHLETVGQRPAFLSRGYGAGKSRTVEAFRVDPTRHTAEDCGDEPLLLARVAPTYVASDRVGAARMAAAEHATILVLDDGLQNPALTKDIAIAVADGATGIGNGLCLPAGPLRAPVERQWSHVGLLCVVGDGEAGRALADRAQAAGVPVTNARLEPELAALGRLRGRRLLAFAGIGRPQKFFDTLQANRLDVVATRSFPDHHRFTEDDLSALRWDAEQATAALVTTTKDAVRLPPGFPALVLPVELIFDDPDAIVGALAAVLPR